MSSREFRRGTLTGAVAVLVAGGLVAGTWSVATSGEEPVDGAVPSAAARTPSGENTQSDDLVTDDAPDKVGATRGVASPAAEVGDGQELPSTQAVRCPTATISVSGAAELTAALASAAPGDVIELADGTYDGNFVASVSGTADSPIWLCGSRDAVLDAGGPKEGYGFHLDNASYWRLVGFTVTNAQKGVMADGSSGSVIQDLLVTDIGDEGIHLRSASSANAVLDNTISNTGRRKPKFGEGVYVGSAESNWAEHSGGGPDRSDRNVIARNSISGTTSEAVDIKEGTTGGLLADNTFDGTALSGADSWVDVKGNAWIVRGNTGENTPGDGFQTHRILDGWGSGNVFEENVLDVPAPGVGIYVHKPEETGNSVSCTNRTPQGIPVTSTVTCTS